MKSVIRKVFHNVLSILLLINLLVSNAAFSFESVNNPIDSRSVNKELPENTRINSADFSYKPLSAKKALFRAPGNTALDFNSFADSHVVFPELNSPILPADITIEAWINLQGSFSVSTIASWVTDVGAYFSFGLDDGNLMVQLIDPNNSTFDTYIDPNTLPSFTEDVHVAVTGNPTDGFSFYINGELSFFTGVTNSFFTVPGSDQFFIGITFDENGLPALNDGFNGTIDELRIWNVIKTQGEIKANLYKSFTTAQTGLLAAFNFDEGTGTSLFDITNSFTGTLVNLTEDDWIESDAGLFPANDNPIVLKASSGTVTSGALSLSGVSGYPVDPGDSISFAGNGGSATVFTNSLLSGIGTVASRMEAEYFVQVCNENPNVGEAVTFDFVTDAADPDLTYYLLYRPNASVSFYTPAQYTSVSILGSNYVFQIPVDSIRTGWYTLGRGIPSPGNALDFQGGSLNYVSVPNFPAITPEMTVEAWVKRQGNSGGTIVGWGGSFEGENSRLFIDALGQLSVEGLGGTIQSTTDTIPFDIWTHVALTKAADAISLYIGGELSANFILNIDIPESSMNIGASDDTTAPFNYFTGQVDDLRIWSVERPLGALQANLYNTLTGLEAGLEAYYKFDLPVDSDNNSLPDYSGNNRFGQLNDFGFFSISENFVSSDALSKLNNSIQLDGFDDQVNSVNVVPVTGDHTVELWFKKESPANIKESLFQLGDAAFSGDDNAVEAFIEGGFFHVWIRENAGAAVRLFEAENFAINEGEWYHVAYTFDEALNELTLYINGVEQIVGETVNIGVFSGFTTPHQATIGFGTSGGGNSPFEGQIDEFRIWNEVLDVATIRSYFNTDDFITPAHPNAADLLLHYSFDVGLPEIDNTTLTTVPDLSGNGNDGSVQNFTLNGFVSNYVESPIFNLPGKINFLGNGIEIPLFNTPQFTNNTQLGAVRAGEIIQKEFQIVNAGFSDINDLVFGLTNTLSIGEFSAVLGTDVLAPLDTTTLTVSYTNSVQGVGLASLNISTAAELNNYILSASTFEDLLGPGISVGFDGTDGFYNLGDNYAFDVTDAFTIEAWAKPQVGGFTPIISKQSVQTFSQGWALSVNGGLLQLELAAESFGSIIVQSVNAIPIASWSHVAVTYDGSEDAGGVSMFINGKPVLVSVLQNTIVAPGTLENIEPTYLGRRGAAQVFTGEIDELRIWNDARAAEDIAANAFVSVDPAVSGLLAYFRMNTPSQDIVNLVGDFGLFESFSTDTPIFNISNAVIYNDPTYQSLNDQSALWNGNINPTSANFLLQDASFIVDTGDKIFLAHDNIDSDDSRFVSDRIGSLAPLVGAKLERNWFMHIADSLGDAIGGQVEIKFFNQLPDSSKTYYLISAPDEVSDFSLTDQLGYYFDNDTIRFQIESDSLNRSAFYSLASSISYPGNALAFDGIDDSVKIEGFGHTEVYTYELWIKPAELNREQTVFYQSGVGSSTRLSIATGNTLRYFANNSGVSVSVNSTTEAQLDVWMHVAVTNDAFNTRLYINGVLEDTQPYIEASDFSGTLFLGADNLGGITQYNGSMEEFRLWGGARTATDILDNQSSMLGNADANFQLNYRFDQSGTQDLLSSFSGFGAYLSGQLFNFDYNGINSGWVTSDAFIPASSGNQNALDFDGVNDYVDLGNPANLNFGTGDFTIETWINVPVGADLTDFPVVVAKGDVANSQAGYTISIQPNGEILFDLSDGGITSGVTSVGQTVNDGFWHHVAVVREGGNTGKIYIDGLLSNEAPILALDLDNADKFYIGTRNENAGFLEGTMDELKIWNIALTIEEIRNHINVELEPASSNDLVSYYRFNEGIPGADNLLVTNILDEKGENTGFLNGFALTGLTSNFILSDLFNQFAPTLSVSLVGGEELIQNGTSSLGTILEGDSISVQIAFTNIGLDDLSINSVDLPTGFTLERDLIDFTLIPFETDTIEIKFISSVAGLQSDLLAVDSDNSLGVFRVTLDVNVYPDLPGGGEAILFNGSASQFAVASVSNSDLIGESFSVEYWARRADNSTEDYAFGQGDSGNNNEELSIGFKPGDVISFSFGGDDHDVSWTDADSEWNHFAFTYNSTTNERKIFVNGIEVGTTNLATDDYLGSGTFFVGKSGVGGEFNGHLDELRIWNVELDEATIRRNLAKKLNNESLPLDSLVAYYRFDDTGSTDILDLKGDYDLAINGGTKEISQANMGDQSTFSYSLDEISTEPFGELLKVVNVSDPTTGTHIYLIDGIPSGSTGGEFQDFELDRSYGVFSPGNTFDVKFGYSNQNGEDSLRIIRRNSLADDWIGNSGLFNTDIVNDSVTSIRESNGHFYLAKFNYPLESDAGSALSFNGSDSHVTLSETGDLDFTNEGTVEVWFLANSTDADGGESRRIISQVRTDQANPATTPFDLYVDESSQKLTFSFGDGSSLTQELSSVSSIKTGRWYHTAVTWDADSVRLLINGLLESKSEKEFSSFNGNTPIQIGASDATGTNGSWDGQIDEIRIWTGAIDVAQIGQFYLTNLLASNDDLISLARYFRFDDGTNSDRLADLVDFQNGVLVNLDVATAWIPSGALTDNVVLGEIADSTALARFFDNADGSNWANNDNWKTSDNLSDWFGVHITNRRVDSLDLSNNNLKGTLTAFNGLELENLVSLKLQDNELDSIGDLSSLTALSEINLQNNLLQFDDLEPVFNRTGIVYSPQKEAFISNDITVFEGETIFIDGTIGGSANSYQWFKDDVLIAGATNPVFTIAAAVFNDDASYRVEVVSSVVDGLTINSNEVIVRVSSLEKDIASLTQFYAETDGDNWVSNTGWLSADINTWFGVIMNDTQTRVIGVSLPGNNLKGDLSEEITEVLNLETVDISDNLITGIPDFTNLSNLTQLDVSKNRIQFADLENNISLSSFSYLGQTIAEEADTLIIARAEDTILMVEVAGSANVYQWFLNDVEIPDANSTHLVIEDLAIDDIGNYLCRVSNSLVSDLFLESTTTNIRVVTTITGFVTGIDDTPIASGTILGLRIRPNRQTYDSIPEIAQIINGTFTYDSVDLADYIFVAQTDDPLYIPTYSESSFLWDEADTILLRDEGQEANIRMVLDPDATTGAGTVGGVFEEEFTEETDGRIEARRRVRRVGVALRRRRSSGRTQMDELFDLIAYTRTNDEGQFTFEELPSGVYRISFEFPGIPLDLNSFVEFEILEGEEPTTILLEAVAEEDGEIVVNDVTPDPVNVKEELAEGIAVFPNPATRSVVVDFKNLSENALTIQIIDYSGKMILKSVQLESVQKRGVIDISEFKNGIYLLRFSDGKNHISFGTFRLIKRD